MLRTRFPPEPNGALHIGHLKAIIADFDLKLEDGKSTSSNNICNLRFDDTNPENESEEFKKSILTDLKWLGYEPAFITSTSDYFNILMVFIHTLIDNKEAYYDASTSNELSDQRRNGFPSPYRPNEEKWNTRPYKDCCIRITIDPCHNNTCMRDPVIARWKGNHVIPTYDLSHPIVDYLEEITHSYCTREFFIRRELYYYIIDKYLKYNTVHMHTKIPTVVEYSRLKIDGVDLSKRKIIDKIESGIYTGFDDPKLFTISGLRKRGHDAKALIHFCKKLSYVKHDGGVTPMHMFESAIREYYECHSIRRFGIPTDKLLSVYVKNSHLLGITVTRPNNGNKKGIMACTVRKDIYISKDDWKEVHDKKYRRFAPDRPVWIKHYGLIECLEHSKDKLVVGLISHELNKKFKPRPTAIQWVSHEDMNNIIVYDPDTNTETNWNIDPNIPKSKVFQLERCGYYKYIDGKLNKVIGLRDKYKE